MTQNDTSLDRARALAGLLDVRRVEENVFEGPKDPFARRRMFGGQVVAQGLRAAAHTVETGRAAHSLHANFLRPGDDAHTVRYRVESDFEGRSFCNRRVFAEQKGRVILHMSVNFHTPEEGFTHQDAMPDVPGPEDLMNDAELARSLEGQMPEPFLKWLGRPRAMEVRRVSHDMILARKSAPVHHMWIRGAVDFGEDPILNRAVLAYASDMALLGTAMLPHGVNWITPGMSVASLDHAVWMHSDVRMNDWHLYTTHSPWADSGRGFCRGRIFTRDGRLVANVSQEGMVRKRKAPSDGQ